MVCSRSHRVGRNQAGGTVPLHRNLETVQEATAIMPDYAFPADDGANTAETELPPPLSTLKRAWPACWEAPLSQPLFFCGRFPVRQKTAQPLPPLTLPMPLFTDASQQFRQMDRFSCGNTGIHRLDARIKIGLSSSIKSAFFPGLRRKLRGSCLSSCSRSVSSAWRTFPWATF